MVKATVVFSLMSVTNFVTASVWLQGLIARVDAPLRGKTLEILSCRLWIGHM